jgi:hypothetical protein
VSGDNFLQLQSVGCDKFCEIAFFSDLETYLRLDEAAEAVIGAKEGQEIGELLGVLEDFAVGREKHVVLAGLLRRERFEVPTGLADNKSFRMQSI